MNMDKSSILGIIPARYHSTRLEGKPLLEIAGKPMIQHVYERSLEVIPELLVATDDNRIMETVQSFGGNVVMTDSNHSTGTNRCHEAYSIWSSRKKKEYKYIINIQGDEPLLEKEHLNKLIECFEDTETSIATLALKIDQSSSLKEGMVYLTFDQNKDALYFSRFPIPYLRDIPKNSWTKHRNYYQHIGIYGFRNDALSKFCSLKESGLEKTEKLEQLRWLEAGEQIKVGITEIPSHPVDTMEDLNKVRQLFKSFEKI